MEKFLVIRFRLENQTFPIQSHFYHLNTRKVQYSHPHCTISYLLVLFMEVGWTANQLMIPMGSPDTASKMLSCETRWSVSYSYLQNTDWHVYLNVYFNFGIKTKFKKILVIYCSELCMIVQFCGLNSVPLGT